MGLVVQYCEHLTRLPQLKRQGILVSQVVAATGGVELASQHGKERGLAAAVGAGDGQPMAWLDLQIQRSNLWRGPGPRGREVGHGDQRRHTGMGVGSAEGEGSGCPHCRLLVEHGVQADGAGLGPGESAHGVWQRGEGVTERDRHQNQERCDRCCDRRSDVRQNRDRHGDRAGRGQEKEEPCGHGTATTLAPSCPAQIRMSCDQPGLRSSSRPDRL